ASIAQIERVENSLRTALRSLASFIFIGVRRSHGYFISVDPGLVQNCCVKCAGEVLTGKKNAGNKKPALGGFLRVSNGFSAPLETKEWCPGTESNRRHGDFQSPALPTELPGQRGAIRRIWLLTVKRGIENI